MSVPFLDKPKITLKKASENIPILAGKLVSEKARATLDVVQKFVEEDCIPADDLYASQIGITTKERFSSHPHIVEDLKKKARELGLWNMFLPKNHFKDISPGFSNLEYGLMAEYLGKSILASEATNCAAPDTGNMELLAKYGNAEQKAQWLKPLLAGEIRSAFLMTEPDVASSDATNIEMLIRWDGGDYVLNGSKWWSSGAGDMRCQIYMVMGKSDPGNPNKHKQQSVILVPASTPGITVKRMLSVMGYDDAPHGHGHIVFNDVRVPASNMVLGEGRGFEIVQGRLGPGRIHHAMRSVGAAERALEYFVARVNNPARTPFGKVISGHSATLERLARCRVEIDAARLVVLNAAAQIDAGDAKSAFVEIAASKIYVPEVALRVTDMAMQAHGGAGVSQDTPLARIWANLRTMRIVDGPDEVHLQQLGKNENRKAKDLLAKLAAQKKAVDVLFAQHGVEAVDPLELNRVSAKAKL